MADNKNENEQNEQGKEVILDGEPFEEGTGLTELVKEIAKRIK